MNERLKLDRKTYQLMDKRFTKKQTLDLLIEQREWVQGGMEELVEMMIDSFSYYDSLVAFSCYQALSCHQYSWALGYALASLWVMAYNARCGAIEIMTLGDYKAIEEEQFHLANQFKTSATYSYQIVNTTDVVALYVKYLRPHVIPPDVDSDEAALFPSWKGTPLAQGEASKKVSNIFRRYGYNLSVTRLRAIISTHLEERFRKNEITFDEYKRFITSGQTHSMATHHKFYAKKRKYEGCPLFLSKLPDQTLEGQLIQETCDKIFPAAPIINDYYGSLDPTTIESDASQQSYEFPSNDYYLYADTQTSSNDPLPTAFTPLPTPPPSCLRTRPDLAAFTPFPTPPPSYHRARDVRDEVREFGIARSDIKDMKKKFEWLPEEIDYLAVYIQQIAPNIPGASKNQYATCLSFLKESAPAEAIQFFHPHHLQNSDRLKNGYLRALQIIKEGNEDNGRSDDVE